MTAAIHWSGPVLIGGELALGLAVILISSRPVIGAALSPEASRLLLVAAALLLLSLPAVYVVQADAAGIPGLVAHTLLATGLLLLVVLAATPLLHPSINAPTGEHPLVFGLGIARTLGLLLCGTATFQADVLRVRRHSSCWAPWRGSSSHASSSSSCHRLPDRSGQPSSVSCWRSGSPGSALTSGSGLRGHGRAGRGRSPRAPEIGS